MSRFQTSWEIAKRSWAVLKSDKSLAWFPVLSALASIAVIAAMGGLIAVAGIDNSSTGDSLAPLGWVFIVLAYVGLAFVQTYFLAGLVAGADMRLHGQDSTVKTALAKANGKLHRLLPWAIVSATVSAIISQIERQGIIGQIIGRLIGLAWSLITFMTIPIIMIEDLGVIPALKRSRDLFKHTWGENVIAFGGLGLVGFLVTIPGALLVFAGVAIGSVGFALAGVGVVWMLGAAVVMSALSGIYRTALYRYASTGEVPGDFSGIDFQAQFRPRRS